MNISRFLTSFVALGVTSLMAIAADGLSGHMSDIGPGYAATSVNTAIFRTNSVVTHGDTQYAAFYDPEGFVTLASRSTGSDDWTVRQTAYRGNVRDGHNVISIGVDRDGYLHVAFDHHGHPLRYARSVAPGSLSLGPLESMVGRDETDVTYPEFYSLPDGQLLFVYRSGYSGGGNMVLNIYDPDTGLWQRLHDILLDGEGERNAYWQMCLGDDGALHLSWVWRETWMVETNHDLCYARSADNGATWQRSDGSSYALPITMATAEVAWPVAQNSELINQTSMTANAQGNPMIATYWREQGDSVPQFRLVEHDGHSWRMSTVGHRSTPFSLSGGGTKMIPISRPRLVADGEEVYYIFRDQERGSRVSIAHRAEADSPWTVSDLTDFSVGAWEPTVDPELWRRNHKLHIFVQPTTQGDGERATDAAPSTVSILEVEHSPRTDGM